MSKTYYRSKSLNEASRQSRTAHPGRRSYIMRVGHESALVMVDTGLNLHDTQTIGDEQPTQDRVC